MSTGRAGRAQIAWFWDVFSGAWGAPVGW